MKIAVAHLKSASPYSSSRAHESAKLDRETPDAYEKRTWLEKSHSLPDGSVYIPQMAFKQALDAASKMLGTQIPGKGKATYTKFFKSGVLVMDPAMLGLKKEDLKPERIHANADGVRGSGKRVWRIFPTIPEWECDVAFHVLANEITKEIFEEHLTQAGSFVGVGRFRPENGGFYGRFSVEKVKWS